MDGPVVPSEATVGDKVLPSAGPSDDRHHPKSTFGTFRLGEPEHGFCMRPQDVCETIGSIINFTKKRMVMVASLS
jgi:hypothetical protein